MRTAGIQISFRHIRFDGKGVATAVRQPGNVARGLEAAALASPLPEDSEPLRGGATPPPVNPGDPGRLGTRVLGRHRSRSLGDVLHDYADHPCAFPGRILCGVRDPEGDQNVIDGFGPGPGVCGSHIDHTALVGDRCRPADLWTADQGDLPSCVREGVRDPSGQVEGHRTADPSITLHDLRDSHGRPGGCDHGDRNGHIHWFGGAVVDLDDHGARGTDRGSFGHGDAEFLTGDIGLHRSVGTHQGVGHGVVVTRIRVRDHGTQRDLLRRLIGCDLQLGGPQLRRLLPISFDDDAEAEFALERSWIIHRFTVGDLEGHCGLSREFLVRSEFKGLVVNHPDTVVAHLGATSRSRHHRVDTGQVRGASRPGNHPVSEPHRQRLPGLDAGLPPTCVDRGWNALATGHHDRRPCRQPIGVRNAVEHDLPLVSEGHRDRPILNGCRGIGGNLQFGYDAVRVGVVLQHRHLHLFHPHDRSSRNHVVVGNGSLRRNICGDPYCDNPLVRDPAAVRDRVVQVVRPFLGRSHYDDPLPPGLRLRIPAVIGCGGGSLHQLQLVTVGIDVIGKSRYLQPRRWPGRNLIGHCHGSLIGLG